jgi:hypothetical protein
VERSRRRRAAQAAPLLAAASTRPTRGTDFAGGQRVLPGLESGIQEARSGDGIQSDLRDLSRRHFAGMHGSSPCMTRQNPRRWSNASCPALSRASRRRDAAMRSVFSEQADGPLRIASAGEDKEAPRLSSPENRGRATARRAVEGARATENLWRSPSGWYGLSSPTPERPT